MYDTHIAVEILTNGNWVELIVFPIENPATATEEDKRKAIDKIQDALYDRKKMMKLWTGGISVVLRNLDKEFSIFRIKSIVKTY